MILGESLKRRGGLGSDLGTILRNSMINKKQNASMTKSDKSRGYHIQSEKPFIFNDYSKKKNLSFLAESRSQRFKEQQRGRVAKLRKNKVDNMVSELVSLNTLGDPNRSASMGLLDGLKRTSRMHKYTVLPSAISPRIDRNEFYKKFIENDIERDMIL